MNAIQLTDRAREVLARAQDAARRLNPDARIRLSRAGGGLEATLAERPEPGDLLLEVGGATLLVEGNLEGIVDVEDPHDRLVLREPTR